MNESLLLDLRGAPLQRDGDSGYDAAKESPARSSLLCFPTNSRKEISGLTRKRIAQKYRALEANLPIVGRIIKKAGQHSVGKGIFPRPITFDKVWNLIADALMQEWGGHPGVYSIDDSRDMWEDQRLVAETSVGDGEFFEGLVRAPGTKAPMVQPFDIFEIDQPGDRLPGERWQDGVRSNAFDRPIEYAVRELPGPGIIPSTPFGAFRRVSRNDIIHVFRRRRAKQVRGLSEFYSGENSGIDALDLESLVTGTAKLHSALAIAVKKKAAEACKSGISGHISKTLGTDDKITQVNEEFWQGAAIQYLASDEGIELLTSEHPGTNIMEFLKWLYRNIAMATGLPYEVVCDLSSLGGATARAILEDAQWWFEMIQDRIIERHSRRIYIWRLAIAMHTGEIPVCKDPVWWACAWRGPAKLTVDIGRTAEANIKLIRNGMLSHERYYEERAQDAKHELTSQMDFLEWLREQCTARNLPIEWILEQPGPVAINIGGQNAPATDKDEEKKKK